MWLPVALSQLTVRRTWDVVGEDAERHSSQGVQEIIQGTGVWRGTRSADTSHPTFSVLPMADNLHKHVVLVWQLRALRLVPPSTCPLHAQGIPSTSGHKTACNQLCLESCKGSAVAPETQPGRAPLPRTVLFILRVIDVHFSSGVGHPMGTGTQTVAMTWRGWAVNYANSPAMDGHPKRRLTQRCLLAC